MRKFDVKVILGKNEAVEYTSPSPSTWSLKVKNKIKKQVTKIINRWLRSCNTMEKANVMWKNKDTLTVQCVKTNCSSMQTRGKRHVAFIKVSQSFPSTYYRVNNKRWELLFIVK